MKHYSDSPGYNAAKFKAEVIADSSGEWTSNGLRFDTEDEAQIYVNDLASRWTLVRQTRIIEV